MDQQIVLKNCLDEAVHLSKKSYNLLRKSDFEKIFGGLSLDEDKLKLIQDFLLSKNVKVLEEAEFDRQLSEYASKDNEEFDNLQDEDRKAIDYYYEDLQNVMSVSDEVYAQICQQAMDGDESAKAQISELYLPKVVDIAKLYANQGVLIEDLIGEGNIGLLTGVGILECVEQLSDIEGHLGKFIMEAMDRIVAEVNEEEKLIVKLAEGLKKNKPKEQEEFDVFNGDELLRAAFEELEEDE